MVRGVFFLLLLSAYLKDQHDVVAAHLRAELEDIFLTNKVNMVMTGHLYSYERTCPVARNACQKEGGIVHLRVGTAGGTSDNCKAMDPECPNNHTMSFNTSSPFLGAGIYAYGLVSATAYNASMMEINFIANNGTLLDSSYLIQ